MSVPTLEEMGDPLPHEYPVAILMQRRGSDNPWIDEVWEALGIVAGEAVSGTGQLPIRESADASHYLLTGFRLKLFVDECESYYHNLMTPHPRCYVVAREDAEGVPIPFLVSLSFDEAHAYLEAGELIYAVDIPPEVYCWCEAFVLSHYVPQRKYKRKLSNWKGEAGGRRA